MCVGPKGPKLAHKQNVSMWHTKMATLRNVPVVTANKRHFAVLRECPSAQQASTQPPRVQSLAQVPAAPQTTARFGWLPLPAPSMVSSCEHQFQHAPNPHKAYRQQRSMKNCQCAHHVADAFMWGTVMETPT